MAVHTHGGNIVQSLWDTKLPAPWPTQPYYPDSRITSPGPILLMQSTTLGSSKHTFCNSTVWLSRVFEPPAFHIGILRCSDLATTSGEKSRWVRSVTWWSVPVAHTTSGVPHITGSVGAPGTSRGFTYIPPSTGLSLALCSHFTHSIYHWMGK